MYDLSGRTVVISGASRGIGRALARACAGEGANLALLARTGDPVHALAMDLKKTFGIDAIGRACDIRDAGRVEAVIQEAGARFGHLDLVVCNAGILGAMTTVAESDPQVWANTIDVNLNGAFYLARCALRQMKRRGGGRLLFVTSSVGRRVRPNWGAYCISKVAVEGLARLIAAECPDGMAAFCVNPGGTATDMRRAAFPSEDPATLPTTDEVAAAFLRILRKNDPELNGETFDARDFM